MVAGAASLVLHAGVAVLILQTPLPAAQQQESWTTEVNFAGSGWNEYAETPTPATPPPPRTEPPPDAREADRELAQAQPAPSQPRQPEPPPPRERMVRPGIDESTSPDSPAWLGAAQATPHEAPLSQVDQAAQSMDPGLPGEPGTVAPDASESPTASPQPGAAPPSTPAGAPAAQPASAAQPSAEPAPAPIAQAAPPIAPPPTPVMPTTPPALQQLAAGPIQTDRINPAPGDEFATPVPPTQDIKPQPTQVDPMPEPVAEPAAAETTPAELAKVEPPPVEPAPVEPAPVEPQPDARQPEPAAVDAPPALAPVAAPVSPSDGVTGPATNVLGAPSNAASPAAGEGGNMRMPGPRSDAESVAASRTVSMTFKPGQPLAGKGLRVRPAPLRLSNLTRMTASPRNPIILIKFNRRGIVTDVDFENNQGTGFPDVDGPLRDSIFRWTATGKVLQDLPTHDPDARVVLKLEYIFRE